MKSFTITINGVPPVEEANHFWKDIAFYKVNFLVWDKASYIYGNTSDENIEALVEKAKRFGFKLELEKGESKMTISHLKLYLKQDCDMNAVKEIVNTYEGAKLDENNYIVYFNAHPNKVGELVEELHAFTYGLKVTNEVY